MSMLIGSAERTTSFGIVGKTVSGITNVHEALKIAELDGLVKVSSNPVSADIFGDDEVTRLAMPGKFITYRTTEDGLLTPLGVVGNRYVPIQDSEAFDFLNLLVDESGASFDSVGTIAGGKQSIVAIKFPDSMSVAGFDNVDMYLMAKNSHDGSSSFTVNVTPIRLTCLNQVNFAIKSAPAKLSLRHTNGATAKVAQARDTLGLVFKYQAEFEKEVARMYEQTYTDSQFKTLVENLFPIKQDGGKASETMTENTRAELHGLWNGATQTGIKGTKWGAYNTIVEWADWLKPVRGAGDKNVLRAERTIVGSNDKLKNRALSLI